jgi:hypothetical protein
MRHRSEISGMILLADLRRLPEDRAVLGRIAGLGGEIGGSADRRRSRVRRVCRSGRTRDRRGGRILVERSRSAAAVDPCFTVMPLEARLAHSAKPTSRSREFRT